MELRRVVDLAWRGKPATFHPLTLARHFQPSRSPALSCSCALRHSRIQKPLSSQTRPIATSKTTGQQAAAARKEDADDPQDQQQGEQPQATFPQPTTTQASRESSLDFLSRGPRWQTNTRPSMFDRDERGGPSRREQPSQNPPMSLGGLLENLPAPGSQKRVPRRQYLRDHGSSVDMSRMLFPKRPAAYDQDGDVTSLVSRAMPRRGLEPDTAPPSIKLGPSAGRMVEVDKARNMDVGRAFRMLDMRCNANRVKADMHKQRFHERAGLKRKRLKRERWRANFKVAVQATVRRVEELNRQGW